MFEIELSVTDSMAVIVIWLVTFIIAELLFIGEPISPVFLSGIAGAISFVISLGFLQKRNTD